MRRSWCGIVLALLGTAACANAGESLARLALPAGLIQVQVYFDRDGTRSFTTQDTLIPGVRVALVEPGGTDTIRVVTTGVNGIARFDSLPVGSYRVVVDRHALADSIGVVDGDTGIMRLTAQVTAQFDSLQAARLIRLGYGEFSLAAARALPAGRRILVRGKVVSALQFFRDSSAFVVDTSGSLRITGARPRSGGGGNNVGDSVLVLGTTGQRDGEGVLQDGIFSTYGSGIAPVPLNVSVSDAHTARGGALDAVLIQLTGVRITDTLSTGPDFAITVADLADTTIKTTVLVDQLLNAPHSVFLLGHSANFRGVLVPVGDGTWVLKPRGANDIVVN